MSKKTDFIGGMIDGLFFGVFLCMTLAVILGIMDSYKWSGILLMTSLTGMPIMVGLIIYDRWQER